MIVTLFFMLIKTFVYFVCKCLGLHFTEVHLRWNVCFEFQTFLKIKQISFLSYQVGYYIKKQPSIATLKLPA